MALEVSHVNHTGGADSSPAECARPPLAFSEVDAEDHNARLSHTHGDCWHTGAYPGCLRLAHGLESVVELRGRRGAPGVTVLRFLVRKLKLGAARIGGFVAKASRPIWQPQNSPG